MIDVLIISDIARPDADEDKLKDKHREMLDELNSAAREARWPGVKFSFYGYDKAKGVIQIQAIPGDKPGTMHLLKAAVSELRASGTIESGGVA
ncbi:hypothetical protein [Pseudovibrio sp. POLY-S9]|uniref:hypothetical protein n=1 Tax=Pseudovibrio sp. POLY-S9 TaxID=1576596 RepID=UPI00070CFB7E|nr:hypothetical protein [Pseudovibrio sp. POLY-S9]